MPIANASAGFEMLLCSELRHVRNLKQGMLNLNNKHQKPLYNTVIFIMRERMSR